MGIMSIPFAQFHVGGECGNAYLGWPYADECLGHRVSSTYGLISQTFPTRFLADRERCSQFNVFVKV